MDRAETFCSSALIILMICTLFGMDGQIVVNLTICLLFIAVFDLIIKAVKRKGKR